MVVKIKPVALLLRLLPIQLLLAQQPIPFQGPCPHGLVDGSQGGAKHVTLYRKELQPRGVCQKGGGKQESLTGVFFHPQGWGKAAMLSVSKPSNSIKKRQIFSHVSSLLILDRLIYVLSGASYFTATVEG